MITLEASGIPYEGFTEVKIFRSIETISGSFQFSATSSSIQVFPIKAGEPCKAFIGGTQVINGFVDSVSVEYDSGSHRITIAGRDKTADVIDSTIVAVKEFSGLGLVQIIEKVLADNGLPDIQVINEAGVDPAPFPEGDPSSSPVSQTVFDFIEMYARKRQVLLTGDGDGNIVLARSSTETASVTLENIVGGEFNNIKSAIVSYDFTQRFSKYTLQSGQNPAGNPFGATVSLDNVAVQNGFATDASRGMRASRVTEIISETSDTNVNLTQLATWTKNLARARSTEYECIVQGYHQDVDNTTLWKPNILVKVNDEFADINATQLVKSVEYNLSLDGGSATAIVLVDPDSYTLQTQIDAATQKANKKGDEFTFEGL